MEAQGRVLQDLAAELAALRAENEALRARKAKQDQLVLKVSAQGGVSVYGMGKWPVTLYKGQWERLLGQKDEILAFIEANKASLSEKKAG